MLKNIIIGIIVVLTSQLIILISSAIVKKEKAITVIKTMYSFKVQKYNLAIALLLANWFCVLFCKWFVVFCCVVFAAIVLMIGRDYLKMLFMNIGKSEKRSHELELELKELARSVTYYDHYDLEQREETRNRIDSIRKKL